MEDGLRQHLDLVDPVRDAVGLGPLEQLSVTSLGDIESVAGDGKRGRPLVRGRILVEEADERVDVLLELLGRGAEEDPGQVVRAGRSRRAHALTRRVTHPSRRTTRDGDRTDGVGDESAHRHARRGTKMCLVVLRRTDTRLSRLLANPALGVSRESARRHTRSEGNILRVRARAPRRRARGAPKRPTRSHDDGRAEDPGPARHSRGGQARAARARGCHRVVVSWLAIGPSMEPRGPVFAVYVLLFVATFAGHYVARFPPLPPLLGQLVAGFVMRNVPGLSEAVEALWTRDAHPRCAPPRSGSSSCARVFLDVAAVYRLRWPAARLAFGPSTAEALTVALLAKPALNLPWTYCAVLGYLFAAISPAVVIPSLLRLQDKGYGVKAGVPALVTTAASVDVVYAIAGFGVCAGFLVTAAGGGASSAAWRAPTQIVGGALLGYLAGRALGSITPPDQCSGGATPVGREMCSGREVPGETPARRAAWLLGMSLLILFAGAEAEMTGGAALGVIVASAAAWPGSGCAGRESVRRDPERPVERSRAAAALRAHRRGGGRVEALGG